MSTSNWESLIDTGEFADAARACGSVKAIAAHYGVAQSTIRRAWKRHGDGDLQAVIDGPPPIRAADLDAMDLAGPRRKYADANPAAETFVIEPADGERWLVPGDIHYGIQDDVSVDLMRHVAEDWGIDRVVNQGDLLDCYGISRYDKQAERIRGQVFTLADEARLAAPFLKWCASTDEQSVLITGNHEARLGHLTDSNPGLFGSINLRSVFDIPRQIKIIEHQGRVRAGSLVVEHGDGFDRRGGETAVKNCLTCQPDQTTIFGHTHRIRSVRRSTYDRHGRPRTRAAMTIGHMSIAEKHRKYMGTRSNWQQGFVLVEFYHGRSGDLRYTPYQIEIHDHEFCFNGTVYQPRRKSQRGR
jgi:hypothetical protein